MPSVPTHLRYEPVVFIPEFLEHVLCNYTVNRFPLLIFSRWVLQRVYYVFTRIV